MSTAVFLTIMEAYRGTLGSLYPRQDPVDVVKVFEECAAGVTTQDKIRRATGLTATNLSKIVKRASATARSAFFMSTSSGSGPEPLDRRRFRLKQRPERLQAGLEA